MHIFKKGFTLIELLVVIAIIGILASIVSVSLTSARAKARDAKRISDIRTIQLALETYYSDNGQYPNTTAGLVPNYIGTVPCDPNSPSGSCTAYKYTAYDLTSAGTSNCNLAPRVLYHLGAVLEDTTNTALSQDRDLVAGATYTACSSSGADFNGTATSCVGTTGQLVDTCYDVASN
jgi:prepilin-type N-terminal cleavage/methylation domain-containing protein